MTATLHAIATSQAVPAVDGFTDPNAITDPNAGTQVQMTREGLYNALRAVSLSMSADETRFHLNGVLLACTELRGIEFVATDGHTLALVRPSSVRDDSDTGEPLRIDNKWGHSNLETIIPADTVKQWIIGARSPSHHYGHSNRARWFRRQSDCQAGSGNWRRDDSAPSNADRFDIPPIPPSHPGPP